MQQNLTFMTDLHLSADKNNQTPLVHFKTSGELKIKGSSYPEDPMKFYGQVIDWVKELKKLNLPKIELTVCLDYFNTSTSKLMLYIFRQLESIYLNDKKDVRVIWYYHSYDEDMIESGKDYSSLLEMPFQLMEITS